MSKQDMTIYQIMDNLASFSEKLGANVGKCPVKEGTCALYIYAPNKDKYLYVDKDYNNGNPALTVRYEEKVMVGSWELQQKIMVLKDGKSNEAKAIIKTFIKENYV